MRTRKTVGVLVLLVPLGLAAMAAGWFRLLPVVENELGVSRAVLNLASLGGLIAGLAAGPLVDWKGSRLLIVGGGPVAALGLLIFSTASILPISLTGGFLANAGVGLAGGIVIRVLVADWFVRYRGTFLGLTVLGSGLGGWFGSLLVGFLAQDGGYRIAVGVLALGGVGVAVAGFTLIRSHPAREEEDDPSKVRVPGRRSPQLERMIPAGQYIKSPGLWRALVFLGLASAAALWVVSGISAMEEALLEDRFGSGSLVGFIAALFVAGSVVGGIAWSVAADFWTRNRLLRASGLGSVVALVVLFFYSSFGDIFGYGALLFLAGLFLGGLVGLIVLTLIDYMGVRLLGTLSLAFGLLSGVGGAVGSLTTVHVLDAFGHPWPYLIGAPIIALAVLAATRAPCPAVGVGRLEPTLDELAPPSAADRR